MATRRVRRDHARGHRGASHGVRPGRGTVWTLGLHLGAPGRRARELRRRRGAPGCLDRHGGVFPTYHWREVLAAEPHVDAIVRGEGEETAVRLVRALEDGSELDAVAGIAFRDHERGDCPHATEAAEPIKDLDGYRVGWELIDFRRYTYWGRKRAVVVQFSRGCPHPCNYCGQRGFWTRWRHRDPKRFAAELAWLHREHGVEVVNFADENPTVDKAAWRRLLEALIAESVPLTLVGSTRADDIVRDADILPLYRAAGWTRFLLGMENTDEATLLRIRKGGTTAMDREAIRLLRANGIISMATWVAGFDEDTDGDFWRGLLQLIAYDPDQMQALFVTPHRWTPYFRMAAKRRVIQTDVRRWDYKHQVLATRHVPPWRVLLWVKAIEVAVQLRPRSLWRTFLQPDRRLRHAMRWYTEMGRRVWFYEVKNFFVRDARVADGPTLEELWGPPQDDEERSMAPVRIIGSPGDATRCLQPSDSGPLRLIGLLRRAVVLGQEGCRAAARFPHRDPRRGARPADGLDRGRRMAHALLLRCPAPPADDREQRADGRPLARRGAMPRRSARRHRATHRGPRDPRGEGGRRRGDCSHPRRRAPARRRDGPRHGKRRPARRDHHREHEGHLRVRARAARDACRWRASRDGAVAPSLRSGGAAARCPASHRRHVRGGSLRACRSEPGSGIRPREACHATRRRRRKRPGGALTKTASSRLSRIA